MIKWLNITDNVWNIIHTICELWTFLTIVVTVTWFIIPSSLKERAKVHLLRLLKKKDDIDKENVIGNMLLDDISFVDGPYKDYCFEFKIDKGHVANVPEDFKTIANRLRLENEERKANGQKPVYSDLIPYAVHNIDYYRTQSQDMMEEIPVCHIELRESSYFYSLVSILAMDEKIGGFTIRDKYYLPLIEKPSNPSPHGYDIVHGLGINTLAYTKDGFFVFGKRETDTVATGQGCLHLSVGEHLNKMLLDHDHDNRPNIIKTLKRGIREELGIDEKLIEDTCISFYGIALSQRVCQYGVLGFTHLEGLTKNDVLKAWQLSKDGRYENRKLVFIDADISSIVKYLNTHTEEKMTKFALLNVCLALMEEKDLFLNSSQKRIEHELKGLRPDALD